MTDSLEIMEHDNAVYKTLLESTKAIPWKIDWDSMKFSYIGPQIEQLLGWSPASWLTVEDWATRMHPEDREWVVNFCVAQSKAGVDHEADYRALTKDGTYIWIRDVVHVVRKENGDVDSLIGFMFDISERKKAEDKLISLQKELEDLSYKDALTGIANRRMFDSVLEAEWTHAQQKSQPLSVILLDIDFFKQYNDHYGHIQGDHCLRLVAELLGSAATRARDFFARYGGEEFVFVLPETDQHSAQKIAERCRKIILNGNIPHDKSDISNMLTISLGVGTIIPTRKDEAMTLIEQVDKCLYLAKTQGRNQTVSEHPALN